jgi:hypothetical protein
MNFPAIELQQVIVRIEQAIVSKRIVPPEVIITMETWAKFAYWK